MLPGRAVDAAGAVGRRAAPDALVRAGAVTVLARRRMDASRPVGRRAAPFAALLVIAMLVFPRRRVDAPAPVARRSAMPAFCTHDGLLLQMNHHAHFARRRSFHASIRLAKFSILSPNACSFRIALSFMMEQPRISPGALLVSHAAKPIFAVLFPSFLIAHSSFRAAMRSMLDCSSAR